MARVELVYTLVGICKKSHNYYLCSFLDIWENVKWPRFLTHSVYLYCTSLFCCNHIFSASWAVYTLRKRGQILALPLVAEEPEGFQLRGRLCPLPLPPDPRYRRACIGECSARSPWFRVLRSATSRILLLPLTSTTASENMQNSEKMKGVNNHQSLQWMQCLNKRSA